MDSTISAGPAAVWHSDSMGQSGGTVIIYYMAPWTRDCIRAGLALEGGTVSGQSDEIAGESGIDMFCQAGSGCYVSEVKRELRVISMKQNSENCEWKERWSPDEQAKAISRGVFAHLRSIHLQLAVFQPPERLLVLPH